MAKKGNPNITEVSKATQFTSENQPENRGRKGKSVTEWLNEYGDARELEFKVTITKTDGTIKTKGGKVESTTTINQLIATTIINKAVQGDSRAITTFLDRTEGKSQQYIDHTTKGNSLNYQPIWGVADPILDDTANNSSKKD